MIHQGGQLFFLFFAKKFIRELILNNDEGARFALR